MAIPRICSISGCDKPVKTRSWCVAHYKRWIRHGNPLLGATSPRQYPECTVEGCDRPHEAHGYCTLHYQRTKRTGTTDPRKNETRLCTIDGCGKKHFGNGFCRLHHRRWKAHGNPEYRKVAKGDAKRFFEEVVLGYEGNDCLIWPFHRNPDGYGVMLYKGKPERVQRVICFERYGLPPATKNLAAHSCGKGSEGCVNPKHLRWASHLENSADAIAHGTIPKGENTAKAKLTEADVKLIRSMSGIITGYALAKQFGVDHKTIRSIWAGRTWKHVL